MVSPSEEALFAKDLAQRAFAIAKLALVSSLGLFGLLAGICLTRH